MAKSFAVGNRLRAPRGPAAAHGARAGGAVGTSEEDRMISEGQRTRTDLASLGPVVAASLVLGVVGDLFLLDSPWGSTSPSGR